MEEICKHNNRTGMDWPDGGYVEVCEDCKKSRHLWEQGQTDWIMVEDIEGSKKELQEVMEGL